MFNRLEQPWFDDYGFDPDIWILCDQLAVAVALDPSIIVESRKKKGIVELSGHHSRGNVLLESRRSVELADGFQPNVLVVDRVDEKAFMKAMLGAFAYNFDKA